MESIFSFSVQAMARAEGIVPINYWQALVDDFRTTNWLEIVPYPEIVYQKTRQFLNIYNR